MIRVSAVVPTHDRPQLLLRALQSILEQTSPAEEILVVDNGRVPVQISSLPDNVQLIQISPGAGVSAARNAGVEAARHEYVAFLDDDDWWTPTYLEHVRLAIAAHPVRPTVVLGNKHREVDGAISPYKMIRSLEGLREQLLYMNPGVAGQNLTVERNFHITQHPGFRTALRSSEDRAYLIDAIDAGAEIVLAPKAVVVKVIHPGEQLTDRLRVSSIIKFTCIYWSSMGRMQRIDNARKVINAIRTGVRRPSQTLGG